MQVRGVWRAGGRKQCARLIEAEERANTAETGRQHGRSRDDTNTVGNSQVLRFVGAFTMLNKVQSHMLYLACFAWTTTAYVCSRCSSPNQQAHCACLSEQLHGGRPGMTSTEHLGCYNKLLMASSASALKFNGACVPEELRHHAPCRAD
eukprot:1161813-Pelagomonas_calceolata.AAC.3